MRVVSTRAEWVRALSFVLEACDRRAKQLAASCILLKGTGAAAELSAYDGLMAARATMVCKATKDTAVGLPGADLLERVRSMPEGDITLAVTDKGATLTSGKRKHGLRTLDPAHIGWTFPVLDDAQPITVPGNVLADCLSRVAYAQHENTEGRGHGTKLVIAAPVLKCYACTDRGQATFAVEVEGLPDVAVSAVLSNRVAATLCKIAESSETVTLQFSANRIAVGIVGRLLTAPLMVTDVADFTPLLQPAKVTVRVSKEALESALRGIECAATGQFRAVDITVTKRAMVLDAVADDGHGATDEIGANGDPFRVSLPIRQTLHALAGIESDDIHMWTSDAVTYNAPVVVEPVEQTKGLQRHLVCPRGIPKGATDAR